jgi:hypothetical protein
MVDRFDGHNRGDYYYPRTSREAFGEPLYKADLDDLESIYARNNRLDKVVAVVALVVAVIFFCVVW